MLLEFFSKDSKYRVFQNYPIMITIISVPTLSNYDYNYNCTSYIWFTEGQKFSVAILVWIDNCLNMATNKGESSKNEKTAYFMRSFP